MKNNDFIIEADITYGDIETIPQSQARDISYKERHSKDEYFLDKKNKSFPVMNCKDVAAVMHRIGTYKGPLSVEQIKSRLKRRAKELGCESHLPDTLKDKDRKD